MTKAEKSMAETKHKTRKCEDTLKQQLQLTRSTIKDSKALKCQLEVAENQLRSANVRILGFLEELEQQQLIEFLHKWIPKTLNLNITEDSIYIARAYQIPQKKMNGKDTRCTVIAKLSSKCDCNRILYAVQNLKEIAYQVFMKKVLEKLYSSPHLPPPKDTPKVQSITGKPAENEEQRESESTPAASYDAEHITVHKKLYTVSLPPAGYERFLDEECVQVNPGDSNCDKDEDEEASQGQLQKRRRRKRRCEKTLLGQDSESDNKCNVPAESQKLSPLQDATQSRDTDSIEISKNKKRKLKKKRHKEKLRAAGLTSKSVAVQFTYQPVEGVGSDNDDDTEKKTAEVLDFLQATLETYYTENRVSATGTSVTPETIHLVLKHLENHSMPSSDVALLHQLKSLVLLQDIERLKSALEEFQDHSVMPPEEATAVCVLFHYWITDILPVSKRK
ncbi:glutamate-rich protein 1 isoform X1 [Latimeria chalumnae]|uniref:glutamate-rich protein 1 isoform X1 n=1 Tax=Latimeria chalumnae TaxID=7897 RepID=UPI00313B74F3